MPCVRSRELTYVRVCIVGASVDIYACMRVCVRASVHLRECVSVCACVKKGGGEAVPVLLIDQHSGHA